MQNGFVRGVELKTRRDFPFEPFEQFNVRDGSGRVVETWKHIYREPVGNTREIHHFDVQGYRATSTV